MSTAVAHPNATTLPPLDRNPSPRPYPPLAPSNSLPLERPSEFQRSHEYGPRSADRTPPDAGKQSPKSLRSNGQPKIVVKKEPPSSPLQSAARHRPRKLDLNTNTNVVGGGRPSATPGTGREALGIMHDVGLACLSPGFQTQDPTMREQLQRSLSVRDQQRIIIESRLLKSAKGDSSDPAQTSETPTTGKQPATASKKRPPPGLSIVPPAAERFANERVIQSAPLNHSFTGHDDRGLLPRQNSNHNITPATAVNHAPAIQTSNRLPPISDVFGASELNPGPTRPPFLHANSTPSHSHGPPMPSPSYPPQTAHPTSQHAHAFERPREFRSAEEAVQEMTGGREDLQPRLVHYGGHQPPTPPSPQHHGHHMTSHKYHGAQPEAGRRRSRNEYEAGSSPPLGNGRGPRYGPFGEGRDSPATQKAKKDEFLSLCARAWDLFHS